MKYFESLFEVGPIKQLIIQSTPLCNLNCTYCYLSESSRSTKKWMSLEAVIHIFNALADSNYLADEFDIRWHAGEPLLASTEFYSASIENIRKIVPDKIRISHSLQTNGIFISDEWCELFLKHDIRVGISIDGPAFIHDRYRLTKGGKGTHEKVMQGIKKLQDFGIPFEIIAVITSDSIPFAKELYEFFDSIHPTIVALNIEESEGDYCSNLLRDDKFIEKYRAFFSSIFDFHLMGGLKFREIEEIKNTITYSRNNIYNMQVHPFSILTIDWNGNVYTYSPELAGMKTPKYPSFCLGNLLELPLQQILESDALKKISEDILDGVEQCRQNCEYFTLCGGGAPANKLFENGTFRSTETGYCKARYQIPTDIVLPYLESKLQKEKINNMHN